MSEPEKPIQLGLTSEATQPVIQPTGPLPSAESLQFRKAEKAPVEGSGPPCVVCGTRIVDTYYHAQGKVVCPTCASAIQSGQNAPPPHTLLKSFVYGFAAALAGTAIFALVWIISKGPWAIVSILVGYMVGRSVRYASNGLGGRPQQILAALLTYFSISVSLVPVMLYQQMEKHLSYNVFQVIIFIVVSMASPFLALKAGAMGILSLLLTFFGIQRAWHMTGRTNILVMGPYQLGS